MFKKEYKVTADKGNKVQYLLLSTPETFEEMMEVWEEIDVLNLACTQYITNEKNNLRKTMEPRKLAEKMTDVIRGKCMKLMTGDDFNTWQQQENEKAKDAWLLDWYNNQD